MLESADVLKKDGATLLESFLLQGPFNADWGAEDAMAYLQAMRQQLKELRNRETQLRNDLQLFDLSLFESAEIARLEKVQSLYFLLFVDKKNNFLSKLNGVYLSF